MGHDPCPIVFVNQGQEAITGKTTDLFQAVSGQSGVLGVDVNNGIFLTIENIEPIEGSFQYFICEMAASGQCLLGFFPICDVPVASPYTQILATLGENRLKGMAYPPDTAVLAVNAKLDFAHLRLSLHLPPMTREDGQIIRMNHSDSQLRIPDEFLGAVSRDAKG